MLSDFLSLEHFYGHMGAVLYLDDLIEKYDAVHICQALDKGYLEKRLICIGPDCGRCVCWLSDYGRMEAHKAMH